MTQPIPLHIRLELVNYPPEFYSPGGLSAEQLRRTIGRYCRELWENLGISPLEPQIEIAARGETADLWGKSVAHLFVNGVYCPTRRMDRTVARTKSMAPSVLAAEICRHLFDYRAQIITQASAAQLIETAAQTHDLSGWQGLEAGQQVALLRRWIEIGFHLDRLFASTAGAAANEVARALAHAADDLSRYQLLLLTGGSANAVDLPALQATIRTLRFTYSMPLPQIKVKAGSALPDGFVALQINEARLPTHPIDNGVQTAVETAVAQNLSSFVSEAATRAWLDIAAAAAPELVDYFADEQSVRTLTEILRWLAADQIKLNFTEILEGALAVSHAAGIDTTATILFASPVGLMSEHHGVGRVAELNGWQKADVIRQRLSNALSFRYAPSGSMKVMLIDSSVEAALIGREPADIDNQTAEQIIDAVWQEYSAIQKDAEAILTTMAVRHTLGRLLRVAIPELVVLSFQELAPHLSLQPQARVFL